MTAGLSGSYAFNGTNLSLQPSEGKWVQRDSYGNDGNGRPIYGQYRQFELRWNLISSSDLSQIVGFFNSFATGTVVACLPQYGGSQFLFVNYSGCVLSEPQTEAYFEEHTQDVSMIIIKIKA
jgi:hypothetical protein